MNIGRRRGDGGRSARRALTCRRGVVAALGLVLAVVPVRAAVAADSSPPSSTPAAPATSQLLKLDAGFSGLYVPGRFVPVRVTVRADRLVRGRLQATVTAVGSAASSASGSAREIEVPGGSVKQFVLLAQAPASVGDATVKVDLRQGSSVQGAQSQTLQSANDTELVALTATLQGGRAVPGPAPLSVDLGSARFLALTDLELAAAPASLDSLTAVAVTPDDINRLGPEAAQPLLSWVQSGGRLMVDSQPGATVAGLPPAWQPGASGRAVAGRGEVVATGGAMAAGRWAGLVEPSGRAVAIPATATFASSAPPLSQSLATQAGLRLPEASSLAAFFLLYVMVAGPLVWFVLREKRRQEWAWVVVPALGLVFAGGAVLVGRHLRATRPVAHATVIDTGPAGTIERSYVGVLSNNQTTARVRFPSGWRLVESGGQGQATAAIGAEETDAGPQVALPLNAGQFGLVAAEGPVSVSGGLEISANQDGDVITGQLHNTMGMTLRNVAVLVGSRSVVIGDLSAGASAAWTVTALASPNGAPMASTVWGSTAFGPNAKARSAIDLSLFEAVDPLQRGVLPDPGMAVAAGWTTEQSPPVQVRGASDKLAGHTMVLGRTRVTNAASGQVVRGRLSNARGPFLLAEGDGTVVMRFDVPASLAGKPLRLATGSQLSSSEVFNGGAWQGLGKPVSSTTTVQKAGGLVVPSGGPTTTVLSGRVGVVGSSTSLTSTEYSVPLPGTAVTRNTVYVRIKLTNGQPLFTAGAIRLAAG